jgi:hypothetical protein
MKTFYIDVELPDLESEDKMRLRWISSRTLLVKAVVERKGTPEPSQCPEDTLPIPAIQGKPDVRLLL